MKRKSTDSYTKLPYKKYKKHKIHAIKNILGYFNVRSPYIIFDMMAGVGICYKLVKNYLNVHEYIMNDINLECINFLNSKFPNNKITQRDAWRIRLRKKFDIVLFDCNNFTLNKPEKKKLIRWIVLNKSKFDYLILTDSFRFSLKFLKTTEMREIAWKEYVKRIEDELQLSIKRISIYDNNDCALFILKN